MFRNEQGVHLVLGYVNLNYTGDMDDKRSRIWYVYTSIGKPLCWKS